VQQQGQELHLLAQLHKGRGAGVDKVWNVMAHFDEDKLGRTLFNLERELATRILFDIQGEWGASDPRSLELFTQGIEYFQSFQTYPTVQEENLQKAVKLWEKSLSIDPNYVAVMYNLATAYHNLGKHQQAIEMLKRLRLQPNHNLELEIAYNLGAAYYHSLLGNWAYDYAEHEFSHVVEALSDKEELRGKYRDLLALAYCGLTSVYAQKIHYETEKSEQFFQLATEHYNSILTTVPADSPIVAIAHTAIGMVLLNIECPDCKISRGCAVKA
jgi:tetratricopeptide (TPR) repeat protein